MKFTSLSELKSLLGIVVRYRTIERDEERHCFTTLDAARQYAWRMIGRYPEMTGNYAISDDGAGKITVSGCALADLFPQPRHLRKGEAS